MTTTHTILVVEDNLGIQHLIATGLRRAGYQVVSARSGSEAITHFSSYNPDLVLMDILMPGMDGFETTQRIRNLPNGSTVPVIFLTSVGDVKSRVRGLNLGADDYLVKPVKMQEFIARIQARLQKKPSRLGKMISIFGSHPGAGVTTLTINLACAIHKVSEKTVIIIDGQQPFGDMARMMQAGSIRETLVPYDKSLDEDMFRMALHPFNDGIQLLAGTAIQPLSPEGDRPVWYSRSKVRDIAIRHADYVLIDAGNYFTWQDPPTVQAGDGINLCVFTKASTDIDQAANIKNALRNQGINLWLILNRYLKGTSPLRYESRLSTIPDCFVPDDRGLDNENDEPLYITDPSSPYCRSIEDLANRIRGM